MQISWLGYSSFRLQDNGITVITDPFDPDSKFRINKQGADVVIAGEKTSETGQSVSGNPFIIEGPGEYEVKSVFIQGLPSGSSSDAARAATKTIYLITRDAISIAFIGAARVKELSDEQLEVLEGADLLIVPVGGGPVCTAKEAAHLINQIDPRVVIPCYYKVSGSKGLESLDAFLREYAAPHETTDKLKVHKKDLQHEDTKIIIFKH